MIISMVLPHRAFDIHQKGEGLLAKSVLENNQPANQTITTNSWPGIVAFRLEDALDMVGVPYGLISEQSINSVHTSGPSNNNKRKERRILA